MITTNNIDIFICIHNNFKNSLQLTNKCYKLISPNEVENDSNLELIVMKNPELDHRLWSELAHIYYIWKNYPIKDYIGFCHYRRYFDFKDDILSLNNINNNVDIITTEPEIILGGNVVQYSIAHNIFDWINFTLFMCNANSIYEAIITEFNCSNVFYTNNMFIMKKQIFDKYCNTLFNIMFDYCNFIHCDKNDYDEITTRLNLYKHNYIKDFYPNSDITYNYRYFSYFGERISSTLQMDLINDPSLNKIINVSKIITENKYNL